MPWDEIIKVSAAILVSLGGGGVIIFSLSGFLARVLLDRMASEHRSKLDATARDHQASLAHVLEQSKSMLNRNHYAFTKQYEKEFSVYQDLWQRTVDLYSIAATMKDGMLYQDTDSDVAQKRAEGLRRYNEAARLLKQGILYNKPFYSKDVFQLSIELSQYCGQQKIGFEVREPREQGPKYFEEAERLREKIIATSDRLCEVIRNRLSEVEKDVEIKYS